MEMKVVACLVLIVLINSLISAQASVPLGSECTGAGPPCSDYYQCITENNEIAMGTETGFCGEQDQESTTTEDVVVDEATESPTTTPYVPA